jgi:hypothetical protein
MVYCDGGYFAGSNSSKTADNGASGESLYFRGADILDAVLETLVSAHGLSEATDFILGGCSAGGIATFMHGKPISLCTRSQF